MDLTRRMGEVEGVDVTHNFDIAPVRSTTFMNTKIAWGTKIWQIAFFTTKVASKLHQLPNAS